MNASEQAKHLAAELHQIGEALWSTNALRGRQIKGIASQVHDLSSTDSANLARGLALEQAAQVAYGVKGDDAIEAGDRIHSLASTDAAQALAAHDADLRVKWEKEKANGL